MSYDYDGLVSEIAASRKLAMEAEAALALMINTGDNDNASNTTDETSVAQRSAKELELMDHLSTSVDKFELLSKHCPMTPLLWMQYSLDTYELMRVIKMQEDPEVFITRPNNNNNNDYGALREVVEIRIQLLELGLHEFPGSAILRLHHAELVYASGRMQQLSQEHNDDDTVIFGGKYQKILDDALEILGHGSHRNESRLVVEFYKLRCNYAQCQKDDTTIANGLSRLFLQRAGTPMNDGINAGLGEQYASYCGKWAKASTMPGIETRRRFEAKHYGFLVTYEDDIDVALKNESGVSIREGIDQWVAATSTATEEAAESDPDFTMILRKWKRILTDCDDVDHYTGCWMGLGGSQTANAFVQYAQACFRYRSRRDRGYDSEEHEHENTKDLEEKIQNMAVSVFERGVAECPTVESIWLSYLRRLNYLIDKPFEDEKSQQYLNRKRTLLTKASGVADRAIRNCPYSIELVKAKLKLVLAMANARMLVLDPEELLTNFVVKESLDNGFIQPEGGDTPNNPAVAIELFQSLVAIVRNRVLYVLSDASQTKATTKTGKITVTAVLKYDDPESIQQVLSKSQALSDGNRSMGEEVVQELEDLSNDLREIFDEADSYLRKNHKRYRSDTNTTITVDEGRAALAKERALTESQLVAPLLRAIQIKKQIDCTTEEARTRGRERLAEVLQQHDKATKIWQPPHPGTYMAYIGAMASLSSVDSSTLSSPTDVLKNLRMVRFLYQKALKSVGNPKKNNRNDSTSIVRADPVVSNSTVVAMSLSPDELDYETSLRCLCRDYLLFERHFGSDRSYSECQKSVQKKLTKAYTMATDTDSTFHSTAVEPVINDVTIKNTSIVEDATVPMALEAENHATTMPETSSQKRKRADDNHASDEIGNKGSDQPLPPSGKRQKEEVSAESPKEFIPHKPTTFQEIEEQKGHKQYPKHRVKVGKLEYPAHPFTVKVSFLSPQTEDMDLVDALRPRCGPIVHAKIMRDKHSHRSKGWALVQFEEHESVEAALELSDVLGIKAKSVIIERSHLPAIGLVPSGMHRINPKGEGKSTKRNQHVRSKKRTNEPKGGSAHHHQAKNNPLPSDVGTDANQSESKPAASKPLKSASSSIFAFRPRGVTKGGGSQQRKAKIAIPPAEGKK